MAPHEVILAARVVVDNPQHVAAAAHTTLVMFSIKHFVTSATKKISRHFTKNAICKVVERRDSLASLRAAGGGDTLGGIMKPLVCLWPGQVAAPPKTHRCGDTVDIPAVWPALVGAKISGQPPCRSVATPRG